MYKAKLYSRMRFANSECPSLNDEVYDLDTTPECVMHGAVLRQHQWKDEMIVSTKASCLAGNNNPDYQLQVQNLLRYTLVGNKHRVTTIHDSLRDDLIGWYHMHLGHPANQHKAMQGVFYWPHIETTIAEFVRQCITCKQAKLHGGKQEYGMLPLRTIQTVNPFILPTLILSYHTKAAATRG